MEKNVAVVIPEEEPLSSKQAAEVEKTATERTKEDTPDDVAVEIKSRWESDKDTVATVALKDIPGINRIKRNLVLLLLCLVFTGFVCIGKMGLIPHVFTHKVIVNSWHSLLTVIISNGLVATVHCMLVSDFFDVIWLVCLFQFLWHKLFKLPDVVVWDYITDVLMRMASSFTKVSLGFLVASTALYQIFIKYDNLTVEYYDYGGTTGQATEKVSDYVMALACCTVFKAILYTFVEYARILCNRCFDLNDKRIAANKRAKRRKAVVQNQAESPASTEVTKQAEGVTGEDILPSDGETTDKSEHRDAWSQVLQ